MNKQYLVICFFAFISCEEIIEDKFEVTSDRIAISDDQATTYELTYSNETAYTEFTDGLELILDSVYLERSSYSGKSYECNIDFDSYFTIFDQLSIDSNWTLESRYHHSGDAGRILLLGFQSGNALSEKLQHKLYGTFERYNNYALSKELMDYESAINAADGIHISHSKMGYFQFAIFNLIGTNYCSFWHSLYGEQSIITSKEQLIELTDLEDNFFYKFSEAETADILKINPEPIIELYEDSATVSLVQLAPWEGFTRYTYSISKSWPHQQNIIDIDAVMYYNCGITF
ncbi:MAG: hypothetical protein GQ574_01315 [Crocinitomix sp.]|nr:hypothetical protein [Crocinitomix sp.]